MFLLALVPLAWGYLLASRLLRESQRWLRWSLAYALGLLSFFVGVNAIFHAFPLRWAVYLTLAVLGLGSALLLRLPRLQAASAPLGRLEGPILAILALTAFFEALFWQMQWSDEDFYVHAPFLALFLRDVFPPQNPYLQHLPWTGHYGRDLTIAAISVLFGERFLAVQYVVNAANQAATVLILNGTARRYLRSPGQALWAVAFAFAAVNVVGRRGLLETFTTNSSFAFLFLFVNVYLFLTALTRRSLALAVLGGVAFGSYALFYETSYGLLGIAFAIFPFALCLLRQRWRLRYFTTTAVILILSGALAFVQGGVITDLAARHLFGGDANASRSHEDRRMTREIRIRIPKPSFTITAAFTGKEYPLWSRQLLEDSGTFVIALPLTALLMLWRRNPWGILVGILSVAAILVPAGVDFGILNSESLRFLLVGGIGSAMLFGVTLGMAWDAVWLRRGWGSWVAVAGLACTAAVCVLPSARVGLVVIRGAARYPHEHYLVAEEWGCARLLPRRHCEPIDVSAALALRPIIKKGDRVLADFRDDDATSSMSAEAIFSTFARTLLAGPGMRTLPEDNFSQLVPFWDGEGFRARAFLGSGDVGVLDDLGATYLYLNPENLSTDVYCAIQNNPRLERVLHLEGPGGGVVREAYRVRPAAEAPAWVSPEDLRLVSVQLPPGMTVRHVYPLRLSFLGNAGQGNRSLRISYEIYFPNGRRVTEHDEVRLTVELRPESPARWVGTLWLATPYEEGDYEVRLYGWQGQRRVPLIDQGRGAAALKVSIREPS